MKLVEVAKPRTKLTAGDSRELKQGPWRITSWYGANGDCYERFTRVTGKSIHGDEFKASEKWYHLKEEVA